MTAANQLARALREHEYMPLVQIQDCSELPKDLPLFDSLFVFENAPFEVSVLDRTHTNFPLTAVCYPGDDLGLHLSFDQRYFDGETVERLLGEFKRLLLALAKGIQGDMAELSLLADVEREWLLEGCNQSQRDYPLEQPKYLACRSTPGVPGTALSHSKHRTCRSARAPRGRDCGVSDRPPSLPRDARELLQEMHFNSVSYILFEKSRPVAMAPRCREANTRPVGLALAGRRIVQPTDILRQKRSPPG